MEQFFQFNIGQIVQTLLILIGGFIALGSMKQEIKTQGERLREIDRELVELRNVMVQMARQEERMTAMDQRMLVQGRRIDRMTDILFRYGKTKEAEDLN